MRRSLVIILLALGAGAGIFLASYLVTTRLCVAHMQNSGDDLEWLRTEFHLSDAEMVTVHQLHEGYLPKCHDMCRQIAAKKSELDALLNGNTNLSAVAEAKIAEIAQLRAQCQAQMLRHFFEVSQAMPAEQGQRYLAEMRSLTLKSHELVEQNMSGTDGQANGHHHH